jgi:hypothetical protein
VVQTAAQAVVLTAMSHKKGMAPSKAALMGVYIRMFTVN